MAVMVRYGTRRPRISALNAGVNARSHEVRRQYEAKATQYGDIADMAPRYLGSYVDRVERNYRAEAEAEVRNRVLAEVADRWLRGCEHWVTRP